MATVFFLDTSALAKRYFAEAGSDRVNALLSEPDDVRAISRITLAEITSAIVRRASTNDAERMLTRFDRDVTTRFSMTPLDNALAESAVGLVKRHRLRGCDSLQLASAMRLASALPKEIELAFVCADADLNVAAVAEGLMVVNPGDG